MHQSDHVSAAQTAAATHPSRSRPPLSDITPPPGFSPWSTGPSPRAATRCYPCPQPGCSGHRRPAHQQVTGAGLGPGMDCDTCRFRDCLSRVVRTATCLAATPDAWALQHATSATPVHANGRAHLFSSRNGAQLDNYALPSVLFGLLGRLQQGYTNPLTDALC